MSTEKWKIMKAYEKYGHTIERRSKHTKSAWQMCPNGPVWNWYSYDYRVEVEKMALVKTTHFVTKTGSILAAVVDSQAHVEYKANDRYVEVETCK